MGGESILERKLPEGRSFVMVPCDDLRSKFWRRDVEKRSKEISEWNGLERKYLSILEKKFGKRDGLSQGFGSGSGLAKAKKCSCDIIRIFHFNTLVQQRFMNRCFKTYGSK
ncbi:MAG: hypothetical protein AAB853_00540, partial [Patescibacteria group bacterium]